MRVYARSAFLQGLALMKPEDLPDKMDFAKKYLLDYLAWKSSETKSDF